MIPDNEYTPDFETCTPDMMWANGPVTKDLFVTSLAKVRLLNDLQNVHDSECYWATTDRMRSALCMAITQFEGDYGGKRYKIDTSILDTLSFKDR